MNAKQTYTNGQVTFDFTGGKWRFQVGQRFTYITACPGGRDTAEKVATAISGSFKRTHDEANPLDGLGRFSIAKATNLKPLPVED